MGHVRETGLMPPKRVPTQQNQMKAALEEMFLMGRNKFGKVATINLRLLCPLEECHGCRKAEVGEPKCGTCNGCTLKRQCHNQVCVLQVITHPGQLTHCGGCARTLLRGFACQDVRPLLSKAGVDLDQYFCELCEEGASGCAASIREDCDHWLSQEACARVKSLRRKVLSSKNWDRWEALIGTAASLAATLRPTDSEIRLQTLLVATEEFRKSKTFLQEVRAAVERVRALAHEDLPYEKEETTSTVDVTAAKNLQEPEDNSGRDKEAPEDQDDDNIDDPPAAKSVEDDGTPTEDSIHGEKAPEDRDSDGKNGRDVCPDTATPPPQLPCISRRTYRDISLPPKEKLLFQSQVNRMLEALDELDEYDESLSEAFWLKWRTMVKHRLLRRSPFL